MLCAPRRGPEAGPGLRAAVRAADLPGDPRGDQELHPVLPQDRVGSHRPEGVRAAGQPRLQRRHRPEGLRDPGHLREQVAARPARGGEDRPCKPGQIPPSL